MRTSTIILAALLATVFASVFVYYPVDVTLQPVSSPPVVLAPGSNAGGTDLGGETITVSIGASQASASITLHPTYQQTYYHNITVIKNTDTANSYYITIIVNDAFDSTDGLPSGTQAYLIITDGTTQIANITLTGTGSTQIATPIPANGNWTVSFQFIIPEGTSLPTTAGASFQVVYSPTNELPP